MRNLTGDISARLSLRANFSWYLVGNIVYAGCQWGILVALAKLGSPEMVGIFSLGLAITAPIFGFASLKMRIVQATDAKQEFMFGDYLGLRFITIFISIIVIIGIVFASDYGWQSKLVILAVGVSKAVESISDVFHGLFQRQERMDRGAMSLLIKGPLSLIALCIGVYFTDNLIWGIFGMVVVWLVVLVTFDRKNGILIMRTMLPPGDERQGISSAKKALHPNWDVKTLRKLTLLLLPLAFVVLLDSLLFNIPRYFIGYHLGAYALGIFAALASFERVGNLVVHAMGRSVSPRLSQYYQAKKSADFRILLLIVAGIGVILAISSILVVILAGKEIISLFYGPEYINQPVFLLIIIASGISIVSALILYAITAARYFKVQLLLYLCVTTIIALASYLLIPIYGLIGAAWAVVVARCVEFGGILLIASFLLLKLKNARVSINIPPNPGTVQVELFGCTGAGKTTLAHSIMQNFQEDGVNLVLDEEYVLNKFHLNWVRNTWARKVLLNIIPLCYCRLIWRGYSKLLKYAWQIIISLPVSWFERFNLARNVFIRIGKYCIVRHNETSQKTIFIVDGGTIQLAQHLFAHVASLSNLNELSTLVQLLPFPDVAIYVAQSHPILIERTLKRGHKRIPENSYRYVSLFVDRTVNILDKFVQLMVTECKMFPLEGYNHCLITKDIQDNPNFRETIEHFCETIDSSLTKQFVAIEYVSNFHPDQMNRVSS